MKNNGERAQEDFVILFLCDLIRFLRITRAKQKTTRTHLHDYGGDTQPLCHVVKDWIISEGRCWPCEKTHTGLVCRDNSIS